MKEEEIGHSKKLYNNPTYEIARFHRYYNMHNYPLISIIIPVYNVAEYLPKCLDSVVGQTYDKLEIIVVDDGSTDQSPEICDKYASVDNRIKVIHKQNGGLSDARNAGINIATGDYISFIDSDDWVHPGYITNLITNCSRSNAQIAIAKFIATNDDNYPCEDHILVQKAKILSPENAISDTLYQKSLDNSAWGKLYDARLFNNLRFKAGIGYEDLQLFYKIYEKADRIVAFDTPLYFYRLRPGSYLNTFSIRRADVLDIVDEIENYMQKNHPSLLNAAKSRKLSANFNIIRLLSANKAFNVEIEKRCFDNIKRLRTECLFDPKVRFKNKIGILLSFLGYNSLRFIFSRF